MAVDLPASLSLISASPSQGTCSGTPPVVCQMGTIDLDGSGTLTVEIRADVAGVQSVGATATAVEQDGYSTNNSARGELTVEPYADLAVRLTASPDPAQVGQLLTYSALVENLGPSGSTGGQVIGAVPAALDFVGSDSGCIDSGGTVTCPIPPLMAGSVANLEFFASTDNASASIVTYSLTASGNESDPEASNNSASASTTIESACFKLALDHTGNGTDPTPSPGNSAGCAAGEYIAGQSIELTASPDAGWSVDSWAGTDNDTSTATTNSVTMPSSDHSVSVLYTEDVEPCVSLTTESTGLGGLPSLDPSNSAACPVGEFHPGASISVEASPELGSTVGSWTGTDDDAEFRWVNTVTMPSQSHTVTVDYVDCQGQRTLPPGYGASQPATVEIVTDPDPLTVVYAVEEFPPVNWPVTQISGGGVFDATTGSVKWGPYFDNQTRTLSYEVTAPQDASGSWGFEGALSADGASVLLCGDMLLEPASFHPADLGDNWRMEINEMTSYGAAWKSGSTWPRPPLPIPINYVTNAGLLWKNGEAYAFDPAVNPPWVSPGAVLEFVGGPGIAMSSFDLVDYTPGQGLGVTIEVVPDIATQVYALEDAPPASWTVSDISDGGTFDAVNGMVKWGPFFDNLDRDLSYTATPPAGENGIRSFAGQASFDGQGVAITGDRSISHSCTYELSPASSVFGSEESEGSVSVTAPAGCDWLAQGDSGWLTLTSVATGTGDGVVSYLVSANPTATARDAVVMVEDQTHGATQEGAPCFGLALSHSGSGSTPSADPMQSTDCPPGEYLAEEVVSLIAEPDVGWAVESWAGTDDDGSTAVANTVTMPGEPRAVSVTYFQEAVATVLVVDDDDNAPDTRSAYLGAIATVSPSLLVDVWDTENSDNEPDAGTLGAYSAVVWFSGAESGGFAGPSAASEAALATYLDNGGCLLISAQDYLWDRGGLGADVPTGFMTEYLGLGSGVSDVLPGEVAGSGPAFESLGPYSLVFPFANAADTLEPEAAGDVAFESDLGNTAVSKNGEGYKTAYLGFPFEALPTPPDRENVMRRFLSWCGEIFVDGFESGDSSAWD